MKIKAPAKVNMHLDILDKRDDGYHNLRSLFLKIALCDELEIRLLPENGFFLTYEQPVGWQPEQDLLYKAFTAYKKWSKLEFGLSLHLVKNIPNQAGLGGGSSDAGVLLAYLNNHFKAVVEQELLLKSASIGADIPFFLHYAKQAIIEGIGETITPLEQEHHYYLVLIKPDCSISTREAFMAVDHQERKRSSLSKAVLSENWQQGSNNYFNSFSDVLAYDYPFIEQYKKRLKDAGAFYAELSGSGSVVAGYFHEPVQAQKAYQQLQTTNSKLWLTETL